MTCMQQSIVRMSLVDWRGSGGAGVTCEKGADVDIVKAPAAITRVKDYCMLDGLRWVIGLRG